MKFLLLLGWRAIQKFRQPFLKVKPKVMPATEVLTPEEKKNYITGHLRQLQTGEIAFIGPLDEAQEYFQISFTKNNPKDPFGYEPPIKITFTVSRPLFDALISTYFEEYTRKECEAVMIQKLSDKREFGIQLVPPNKMPGFVPIIPPQVDLGVKK